MSGCRGRASLGGTVLTILLILASAGFAHAQPMGPPANRPGQNWQRVQYPDGRGSIALPPGWRLSSAQQASAEVQGAQGEAVASGITRAIGPAQFSGPGILAGPYLLPTDAFLVRTVPGALSSRVLGRAEVIADFLDSLPPGR